MRSQPLARLATVDRDGQPDVVPVAFEVDDDGAIWVGGPGESVLRTRKFQNVASGSDHVAMVIDDLSSLEPFVARGVRIYGTASSPVERVGMIGPGFFVRITPTVSWSWNLRGEPVGEEWYRSTRRIHSLGASE